MKYEKLAGIHHVDNTFITRNSLLVLALLVFMGAILITGCSSSPTVAENGDTVKVHYTGRLEDGEVFDSSIDGKPLEFTLGEGKVIPGFEQAVTGMKVGESKNFTIPVDQAYGPYSEDLIDEVKREELPDGLTPVIGMQLQRNQGSGGIEIVTIIEVSETTIKIDANHPLAGHDLTFDIELVEVVTSQNEKFTSSPLGEALSNGKPTLAEFGSSSCVPCKQMKPILEELAIEYEGKLNVVIVEVYEQEALSRQYSIMTIPTQIVFDSSGKEVTRHMGLWPKDDLLSDLQELGVLSGG